jgi:hypothetical protein
MIPAGAKVYVATRPVDFRKGPDGLAALVRDTGADPFSGALYVFRAKRAQQATFCIQFAICDDRLPLAPSVRANTAGVAVPARQGLDVRLHGRAA